jgi:hypothetical protein
MSLSVDAVWALPCVSLLPYKIGFSEATDIVSTARVERALLYRVRSASTGDHQVACSILATAPRGAARLSFTARIEGARSDRAVSASKKNGLVAPFPPF